MGISTNSQHLRSTVADDTHAEQFRTTPHDNLSAKEFLERRMTTIEAEVAAKVGQPTYRPQTQEESLITETLHVCNFQLQQMLTPDWLSQSPVRMSVHQISLGEIKSFQTEDAERAKAVLEKLCAGFNLSLKQDEIRKMAVVMAFVATSECIRPHFNAMLGLLRDLDMTLNSGLPDALSKAERILRKNQRVIAAMAESITETLEAKSPETLEAKRLDRIQQATEKQKEAYRHSDEYRALKLLALVDERLAGGHVSLTAETRLARKLSSHGFDGVEKILLGCAPSLRIEAAHLQALKAIFDELAASENSAETALSGAQALDVEERRATATPHNGEALTMNQETFQAEPAGDHISSEQSPETIEYKQLLLEELGIKDSHEREYLSRALTLQGIENAQEAFDRVPSHVRQIILEYNPKLLDPAGKMNLLTFCQDLKEFLDQAYDLHGVEKFDPLSAPANFQDHAALRKTRKSAAAFRIARQASADSEGIRD